MTTEKRIQIIVERNIPLDPSCEVKRKEQMLQRIQLRLQFEELVREIENLPRDRRPAEPLQSFDPRTQLK